MLHAMTSFAAGLAALLLSGAADAAAITSVSLNIRTGPSTAYPAIAVVPASQPVVVYGCTAGPAWCDVSWGSYRGWIAAAYIGPVVTYPVVVFNPVVYHNTFYVGRPYYGIGPAWSPRAEVRRDARVAHRVDRRMDRRWDHWQNR